MKKLLLLTFFLSFSAFAESRQRIVIIDTGLQVKDKHMKFLCADGHESILPDKKWYEDPNGHGTNIVSLVTQDLDHKKFCLTIIRYYERGLPGMTELEYELKALRSALTLKASYVNLSLSGPMADAREQILLSVMTVQGTKIFVAAGNNNKNLDITPFYPASYNIRKNFFVVGNLGRESSNYGTKVTNWEDGNEVGEPRMTGTSQATAIAMNKYIRGIK